MHPLDTLDRRELVKDEFKIGLCNITKCCTEVCPESIHITDNGIIPLKERVADDYLRSGALAGAEGLRGAEEDRGHAGRPEDDDGGDAERQARRRAPAEGKDDDK